MGKDVERNRQSDPGETERLDQTQYQLTPVMHYQEVVQIVKVEGSKAERGRQSGFHETVPRPQLNVSIFRSQPQVDSDYYRAENHSRFGEQQHYRTGVTAGRF